MLDFLTPQDRPEEERLTAKPPSFGIHRYLQGSANLFEENRLLKFAIVGLFGISAVLGAADLHLEPEQPHGDRAVRRGG